MREEYDLSALGEGVRGKYYQRAKLDDLKEQAKRRSRESFEAALAKLPDLDPESHDKL